MIPFAGPQNARIMIVGDAPSIRDMQARQPFSDGAGDLLNKMLHDAGILRSECFLTHIAREPHPTEEPNEWLSQRKTCPGLEWSPLAGGGWAHQKLTDGLSTLIREISLVQPNVIVACGNVGLKMLTGKYGIKSWRGSSLTTAVESSTLRKVIPLYTPSYILRDWSQRHITVQDLRRVKASSYSSEVTVAGYNFVLRPRFATVLAYLEKLHEELEQGSVTISVDLETRAGHIACIGLALSISEAICIPFMCTENNEGYWIEPEECGIILGLRKVLSHRNARVIGQNFIYDTQYIWRHWHFIPNFARDTMLSHHAAFAGLPKGLDYLSSMYCRDHVYWKDEGKLWDTSIPEDDYWSYNCKDAVITYECDSAITKQSEKLGLVAQTAFQNAMFYPVLQAMVRGVRVGLDRRAAFAAELRAEIDSRKMWFQAVLGHGLNPASPKQMKELFYDDFGQREIFNRRTKKVSLDDEALHKVASREPLLGPLVRNITEYRSLNVFLSTFIGANLDVDGRLRCSYNIAGTETYRLASRKDAFDSGLNFQNIPGVKEAEAGLQLPNCRQMFIPDEGMTFFDLDLDRADLQVVVWEADDAELKDALRAGVDIHQVNAQTLNVSRRVAKAWVHGTDYGGGPRTMAAVCGISIHQAETMQARWFAAHPGIRRWHERTQNDLRTKRYVENRFGYRRYYFDRIDNILPEALAWLPQSTVALYINQIWLKIFHQHPDIEVLIQVHDSLAGQFPTAAAAHCIASLCSAAASVTIPYTDPLIIPIGVKTSTESWGDCK